MLKHGSHVKRLSAKSLAGIFALLIVPMTLAFGEDPNPTELKTKLYRLGDQGAKAVQKTILEKVAPKDWAKAGGPHTIKHTKKGLVITASEEVHQQVSLVLELQRLIERQTKLEEQLQAYSAQETSELKLSYDMAVSQALLQSYNAEKAGHDYKVMADLYYQKLVEDDQKRENTSEFWDLHDFFRSHPHAGGKDGIVITDCKTCHQADAVWSDRIRTNEEKPRLLESEQFPRGSWNRLRIRLYPAPKENPKTGEGDSAAILLRRAYVDVYGIPESATDLDLYLHEVAPQDLPTDEGGMMGEGGYGMEASEQARSRKSQKQPRLKTSAELSLEILDGRELAIELDEPKSLKLDSEKE
jgi:hypothetical protein